MTATKSPFYIVEEFVSPLLCEDLIDICNFTVPNQDKLGKDVVTFTTSDRAENIIYERLLHLLPKLQTYYSIEYKGTEKINFEWYPEGTTGEVKCENSEFLRSKWLRVKQRDLTGILFLSDFADSVPFESDYEVYGGKLEFPQHQFGFQPKRGTLVIFPSDPHFINLTSTIHVGSNYQARIQIAAKTPFIYQPNQFLGNYQSWFAPLLKK